MIGHLCRFVLIVAVLLIPGTCPTYGQDHDKGKAAPSYSKYQVLALKHINASEAAKSLNEVFNKEAVRIVADVRSNTLLISADEDALRIIKGMLENLDAAPKPPQPSDISVQIYSLQHVTGDVVLNALATVLSDSQTTKVAFEPTRNALIVSGDRSTRNMVEDLLKTLDQPAPVPSGREMQVRVVWLASLPSGIDVSNFPKPPDDMKEVVGELAKIGVREPFLVSQALINASTNGEFQMLGSVQSQFPSTLQISGTVKDKRGSTPSLQISIEAIAIDQQPQGQAGSRPIVPICRIQTSISAPPGHPVVLGVTPTENATSVFVVQLMPRKTPVEPRP